MPEPPVPPPTTTSVPAPTDRRGALLGGRYHLDSLLARGGMADVYRATDTVLERAVAVKVLHPHLADDPNFVGRFRTEAVAAARLRHPSIVAVFDTCSDPGAEAIVMELISGGTLRQHLDQHGPLDPEEVAELGADLADALHAAHRAGFVHRDVKPANILLSEDGRVLLTDFGIAKVRDDADRTQTGAMLGSVKYLAPEQVEGEPVDARTDVYSLGVVLYESLTGRVPFSGDTPAATALARLHQSPTRPRQIRPSVPRDLDDVVMRAIDREPAARFATAADLRASLLATVSRPYPSPDPDATVQDVLPIAPVAAPGVAAAATPAATGPAPSRRRWGIGTAVLVLVLVALGIAAVLLWRADPFGARGDATRVSGPTTTAAPGNQPYTLVGADAFDPQGTPPPGENNDQVPLAIDANPDTGWSTEGYNTRDFDTHRLKDGVGIWVDLGVSKPIGAVELLSPSREWAASIYVADTPGTTLDAWGTPVAARTGLGGDDRLVLTGAKGRYLLVWITDLGDGPSKVKAVVDEVRVFP